MVLTVMPKYLAALFNKLIKEDQIPEWLKAGVTILIPKNQITERPKNYIPVTCLPTLPPPHQKKKSMRPSQEVG
jgi:hypothetical protein